MIFPLKFLYITQKFSKRHRGIDLGWTNKYGSKYSKNQPVYAVDDGVVIYNRKQFTGGYVIHIRHSNGYVSEYGHLKKDSQKVLEGYKVKKGQQIASMGCSGMVTGNHLHFGLYRGTRIDYKYKENFVDPLKYLCCFKDVKRAKDYDLYYSMTGYQIPSEPLLIRDTRGRIKGKIYNGQEIETYDMYDKNRIITDKKNTYITYRKYLKAWHR